MTDYDKSVGTAGLMRIRDTGSTVEFWILCSDSATSTGGYSWSGVVNGAGVGGTVSLPAGFGSRLLGSWPVSTTQTVSFHQNATGTSGLGGAADLSAPIQRGTVPPAPTFQGFPGTNPDQITTDSMRVRFNSRGDGGSPIIRWELQYATDPMFMPGTYGPIIQSTGTSVVTGLTNTTTYWWRARGVNGYGNGEWSQETVPGTTLSGVYVSTGTDWQFCPVFVSDGASWNAVDVQLSDGSAWTPAGK